MASPNTVSPIKSHYSLFGISAPFCPLPSPSRSSVNKIEGYVIIHGVVGRSVLAGNVTSTYKLKRKRNKQSRGERTARRNLCVRHSRKLRRMKYGSQNASKKSHKESCKSKTDKTPWRACLFNVFPDVLQKTVLKMLRKQNKTKKSGKIRCWCIARKNFSC